MTQQFALRFCFIALHVLTATAQTLDEDLQDGCPVTYVCASEWDWKFTSWYPYDYEWLQIENTLKGTCVKEFAPNSYTQERGKYFRPCNLLPNSDDQTQCDESCQSVCEDITQQMRVQVQMTADEYRAEPYRALFKNTFAIKQNDTLVQDETAMTIMWVDRRLKSGEEHFYVAKRYLQTQISDPTIRETIARRLLMKRIKEWSSAVPLTWAGLHVAFNVAISSPAHMIDAGQNGGAFDVVLKMIDKLFCNEYDELYVGGHSFGAIMSMYIARIGAGNIETGDRDLECIRDKVAGVFLVNPPISAQWSAFGSALLSLEQWKTKFRQGSSVNFWKRLTDDIENNTSDALGKITTRMFMSRKDEYTNYTEAEQTTLVQHAKKSDTGKFRLIELEKDRDKDATHVRFDARVITEEIGETIAGVSEWDFLTTGYFYKLFRNFDT